MGSNLAMRDHGVVLPNSGAEPETEPVHIPTQASYTYGDGQRSHSAPSNGGYSQQGGFTRPTPATNTRKEPGVSQISHGGSSPYGDRRNASDRRPPPPAHDIPAASTPGDGTSLRSLRDRLMRNQT